MRYTKEDLEGRLRLDYAMATRMRGPILDLTAHATRQDAERGATPLAENDAGRALFYRVTYRIKTLLGPDLYSDPNSQPVVVLIHLNKGGNYPFTRPETYVIGPITPWSPHFARGLAVCFERPGRFWPTTGPEAGRKTLGHLLLHLARLTNFDEAIEDKNYTGYNADAVAYWRNTLGSRPITPNLVYPADLPQLLLVRNPAAPETRVQSARASVRTSKGAKAAVLRLR